MKFLIPPPSTTIRNDNKHFRDLLWIGCLCPPPPASYVEAVVPCGDICRWGLWQVSRCGSGPLVNGITVLQEET